jgi:hypothetical protein
MIYIFIYSIISSLYLITCGNALIKNRTVSISEICKIGIFGSVVLSFLSLFLNFFLPIDQNISSIVFFVFLIFSTIYFFKKKTLKKTLIISIITGAITTLILMLDNIYRPDAGLYHLPYTKIINENKIIFGIANIHFRFGHTSIVQYLNAIYNNSLFKDNGILLPVASIFSLLTIYFMAEIYNEFKNNKIYSLYIFLILAYIFYGYNRYSEFGNDALGHLLLIFVSSIFIKNIKSKENKITIKELILLSVFVFMNKPTLIGVFAIPLYYIFAFTKKNNFFNKTNIYTIIFLLLWLIKNIITSGCLIYPIARTCFSELSWYSNDEKFVINAKIQSLDNEAWTKGWPDQKDSNITQQDYVKRFIWLPVWSSHHGLDILKKLSIFLIFLIIIDILILKSFKKKQYKKEKLFSSENKKLLYLIGVSFVGTLVWFLKFPVFRYGSSYIIIFFTSLNIFILRDYIRNIDLKEILKFFKLLIFFIIFAFILKNFLRIYKNFDYQYYNYPWPKIYSDPTNSKIVTKPIYYNNLIFYYLANQECHYNSAPCTNYIVNNVSFSLKNGYKFYEINK